MIAALGVEEGQRGLLLSTNVMWSLNAHTVTEPSSRRAFWRLHNDYMEAFLILQISGVSLHLCLQVQRYREHIEKKHANVAETDTYAPASSAVGGADTRSTDAGQQVCAQNFLSAIQLRPNLCPERCSRLLCRARQWMLVPRRAPTRKNRQNCCCMNTASRRSAPHRATASPQPKRANRSPKPRSDSGASELIASAFVTGHNPQALQSLKADDSLAQVVLADPKDRDKDIVVFLASEHQCASPEETGQRVAVNALHRVCGERAMHRVLPEIHRALWHQLGEQVGLQLSCACFPSPPAQRKSPQRETCLGEAPQAYPHCCMV